MVEGKEKVLGDLREVVKESTELLSKKLSKVKIMPSETNKAILTECNLLIPILNGVFAVEDSVVNDKSIDLD